MLPAVVVSQSSKGLKYSTNPTRRNISQTQAPLQCHKKITTQDYTSSKPPWKYNITPSTYQTTTPPTSLNLLFPSILFYATIPLVPSSYATTCWPFVPLSRIFLPSYSCTQPQVGLSLFYYKYCPVPPGFCSLISSLGIKKYCLALVISLVGYYISHPSYLVCTSNQSGLTPSPESEPPHHPLYAPGISLGFHHPLYP